MDRERFLNEVVTQYTSETRSVDDIGNCYYRLDVDAESDVRCAVGHLIDDDKYDPSIEEIPVDESLIPLFHDKYGGVTEADIHFLKACQRLQKGHLT